MKTRTGIVAAFVGTGLFEAMIAFAAPSSRKGANPAAADDLAAEIARDGQAIYPWWAATAAA